MGGEQLALLAIGALLGLFEQVRIVDLFKNKLGVEDFWANILAAAVAVLTSIAALFVAGEVGIADFTVANFPVVFAPVFALAELLYQYNKSRS